MSAVAADSTLRAYERWAPLYPPIAHNPLMRVEELAMLRAESRLCRHPNDSVAALRELLQSS
jgi:hypothetical protein